MSKKRKPFLKADIVPENVTFRGINIQEECDGKHQQTRLIKSIPISFKLFNTTYNIEFDNKRMNNEENYGICDYSTSKITLSTVHGVNELSQDKILDTYYHEKVHAILDMMHERDLSANEKFVDVFAKLLRQSIETEKY
jgi:hypothetical protein